MEQLIAVAAKEGIWVVLFVAFFVYQLKCNEREKLRYEEREAKYQSIIQTLSEKLPSIMDDLKIILTDLNIIKGKISKE